MGKRYIPEKTYKGDCKGGEDCEDSRHLCKIAAKRDFEVLRGLIKDARYYCRKCGRAAREAVNLCKPSAS